MIALAHDIQEELRATHKLDISTESIELILLCAERLKRAIDYDRDCNAVVETKKVNDKDSTEGVGLVKDAPVLTSTDGPVKCRQCGNTVWRVAADRLGTVCVWCSENGKDRTEGVSSVSLSTGGIDCPRNAAGHPTGPAGITGVTRPVPVPSSAKHPRQPVVLDKNGVPRFKANKIICWMLEQGEIGQKFNLNTIGASPVFSPEDYAQLMQLIGYSVSGFSEHSCPDEETADWADKEAEKLVRESAEKSR